MIYVRKSEDRGYAAHGWLKSHHTFSFADYYDPKFMGFSSLRVINEDYIDAGMGFGTHPHKDMEIISYIVDGSLQHKDTMGNESVITPGEVQYMSAGTGVKHSEFNPSKEHATHLLQIWILPKANNLTPRYGQKSFAKDLESGEMVLTVSPNGEKGSIEISQDARLWVTKTPRAKSYDVKLGDKKKSWIQVVEGKLKVLGQELGKGDAAAIQDEAAFKIETEGAAEFLVFELPN